MGEMIQELLALSRTYFEKMDEDFTDDFILMLINSSIDEYKMRRAYPAFYTDEMIDGDVLRYFSLHKGYIVGRVIPELYNRVGGEGQSMITDAGSTVIYKNDTIFHDVVPICEVI